MGKIICKITHYGITKELIMLDEHLNTFINNINSCLNDEKNTMGFINEDKSVIYFPAELVKNSFIEFDYSKSSNTANLADVK